MPPAAAPASDPRRPYSVALAVLAAFLLATAGTALYARAQIVDQRSFSVRVAASLDSEPVREVVAEEVVRALVAASPDLLAVRPLLSSAVEVLVGTAPFRRLVELAARDAHDALLGEEEQSVILALDRAGALLSQGLRSVSPEVAKRVPIDAQPRLAAVDPDALESDAARALGALAALAFPLAGLALAALVASVLVARDRRAAAGRGGVALAAAAIATWSLVEVGGLALARRVGELGPVPEERVQEAVAGVWTALLGDLKTWALAAAAVGVAVAGVGSRAVTPAEVAVDARAQLRRLLRSTRPAARAARGALAAVAGAALVVRPAGVLEIVALAAGAALLFLGIGELGNALEQRRVRKVAEPSPARVGVRLASLLAAIVAVVGVVLTLVLPSPDPLRAPAPTAADACNGSRALCSRRLNEVAIAATHNSFSAAEEPGWVFANQRRGIEAQLRDGIRGFLLDVHWGVRQPNGRVRTDLEAEGSSRNRVARRLGPEALELADRLVGRVGLGETSGKREPFLCHTLCELGAAPFAEELEVLRAFLDRNRGEVVVLFFEPYVPPAVIEDGLRQAGLLDRVAELARDQPLPTLGELVDADRRVVVFTERDGGSRPWYHAGFSFFQDTALGARSPGDLRGRCARARGEADAPLFLLNHWVDEFPPPATANAAAGRLSLLLGRARRCATERGLVPNLVAVDFYERSAVDDVVAALNRRLPGS